MGMYDDISIFQVCPVCGELHDLGCQTKDLDCNLWHFRALAEDWFTSEGGRKLREGLPIFPQFPLDKSHTLWKDQAEKTEAEATIPEPFAGKLNYVSVIGSCASRNKYFTGKIAIKDGMLVKPVYDIEID